MNRVEQSDPVNPQHYHGDNCMIAIEEVTQDLTGGEAFCTGNVIKYLWRWKQKNGVEDLKKARWYLDRLISYLEG